MAIYPQALMLVKTACLDYRSKKIDIEQLQYTLMAAADLIVAREEKQLRGVNIYIPSSCITNVRRD